jgi:hypothetical protein
MENLNKETKTKPCTIQNVSVSACLKCGNSEIDLKFQPRGKKIYWSEHDEIENIKKFTRNDTYYSSDRISKECLIHKCKTCGYKQAVSIAER